MLCRRARVSRPVSLLFGGVGASMKRHRLPIFGVLISMAILVGAWTISSRFSRRLDAVEFERLNGELFRTQDPDFLRKAEAWRHSIEEPGLRQRWLRLTGRWTENGLRQPDYEVTFVFKNGRREQLAVWVYAEDYVPVHTARWSGTSGGHGDSRLARSEPFTAFAQAMQSRER
jgi:hypothetical protein